MIRKTLGWSDEHGNPREQIRSVTYSELEHCAGLNRNMIRRALDEAIAAHFIRCVVAPKTKSLGQSAVTGLYELQWDESDAYITDPALFRGFFAGNGNLTHIPNAFFDFTVVNETLSVIKVVGAIIRHTIGFQTKYGMRRQQVEMSFTGLQRLTHISSKRTLSEAVQQAVACKHIVVVAKGYFDCDAGKRSAASTYGINWAASSDIGSKRTPERSEHKNSANQHRFEKDTGEHPRTNSLREPATDRKGYRENSEERCEKDTGDGSRRIPTSVRKGRPERSEKDTDIETTSLNNTSKQQQQTLFPLAAAEDFFSEFEGNQDSPEVSNGSSAAKIETPPELVELLCVEGFERRTAQSIARKHSPEIIRDQCEWLSLRTPSRNKLGMLRRAIEENWPKPQAQERAPLHCVRLSLLGSLGR